MSMYRGSDSLTEAVLETTDCVGNVMIKQPAEDWETDQLQPFPSSMKMIRTCEGNRGNIVCR